jgi:CubicO group peptidase (beta-lactamase class C family)
MTHPTSTPTLARRISGPIHLAVTLALLLVPVSLAAQGSPLADLDAFVARVLETWQAPGLALAVVRGDSVLVARGYGLRDIRGDAPVDERSLFAVASTSKAFTVAALGMLVDEGLLSWDDRVTDHLPGFQLSDPYVTREITVRDLLSHRSGLPRGDRLWYGSPFGRDEVIRRVRYLEPAWSFRSAYGYQNIMFLTAGELVEAVAGVSWDEFLKRRIFDPLGMTATTTTTKGIDTLQNVATPHVLQDGKVTPVGWRDFDNLGGAGAINSSAWEMAQWIRLQLGGGVYAGTRLLSDSVMKEMHTPQTVIRMGEATQRLFPDTHFQAYGLGWTLQDYRGRKVVGHGGSLDGMRTQVGMIPEEDLGVVVITNLNNSWIPQVVVYHVFDAFLGPREKDWNQAMYAVYLESQREGEERRAKEEASRISGTSPSLDREAYVGTYTDSLYGEASVRLDDGVLVLEVGPYFVGELEHWHFDTFRARWRDEQLGRAWVEFRLNRQGKVAEMEVEGWRVFHKTDGGG